MNLKLETCDVLRVIKPDKLVVSFPNCDKTYNSDLQSLEILMNAEWDHIHHSQSGRLTHGINQHVMVRDRAKSCCKRGVIQQILPIQEKYKYIVFLYDYGVMSEVMPYNMIKLKDGFRELPSRTYIVNIPGIVPSRLEIQDIVGMTSGERCRSNYVQGDKWMEPAFECVRRWIITLNNSARISVSKVTDSITRVGDFYNENLKSLSEHLCEENFALFNESKYEKDVAISEDNPDWKIGARQLAGLLPDAVMTEAKLKNKKEEELTKIKEEPLNLFAPIPDSDSCFESPYPVISYPHRKKLVLQPDHINHNLTSVSPKFQEDTIAFRPAPVYGVSVTSPKEPSSPSTENLAPAVNKTVSSKSPVSTSRIIQQQQEPVGISTYSSSKSQTRVNQQENSFVPVGSRRKTSPSPVNPFYSTPGGQKVNPFPMVRGTLTGPSTSPTDYQSRASSNNFVEKGKSSGSSSSHGSSPINMTLSNDQPQPIKISRHRDNESLAKFRAERKLQRVDPGTDSTPPSSSKLAKPAVSSVVRLEGPTTIHDSENPGQLEEKPKRPPFQCSLPTFAERQRELAVKQQTGGPSAESQKLKSRRPPFKCSLPTFSERQHELSKHQTGGGVCDVKSCPESQETVASPMNNIVIKPDKTTETVEKVSVCEVKQKVNSNSKQMSSAASKMDHSPKDKILLPPTSSNSAKSQTLFVGTTVGEPESLFMDEMLRGRVFVSDKSVPAYKNINNFPLLHIVNRGLKAMGIESTNALQNRVMPCVMRGRNCFIIDNPNANGVGKSLSYMIPIVANVMSQMKGDKNKGSSKTGPVAVFLTADLPSGDTLKTHLDGLLGSSNGRETIGYFVTQNDKYTRNDLRHGVDIMIATPECLLEMIVEYLEYFSFQRLQYLVVDEADILMTTKMNVVEKVISEVQHGLEALGSRQISFQILFCGGKWIPELEAAYCKLVNNPVAILGPFQAIPFAKIKPSVHFSSTDDKLQHMLDHLRSTTKMYNKVAIVCNNNDSVEAVKKGIVKEFDWFVQTVTHCENNVTGPNIEAVRQWWKQLYSSPVVQVIVCTDNVIKELFIGNATNLVNYQVLTSTARIGDRFSFLWEWFRNPGNDQLGKEVTASIFLTPDENEIGFLKMISSLKEMGASIPVDLEAHFEQVKSGHSKEARLCPGLIYYGECEALNPSTCTNRHFPLPRDIIGHPLIPKFGEVEVLVTRCYTVCSYYARLICHYEMRDGKRKVCRSYENDLRARQADLTKFYAIEENQIPPTRFERNDTVAVEADGQFIRATIEDILTRDYLNRPKSIRFFGIDTGEYMVRDKDEEQIFVLPQNLKNLPKFAVEVVLANMKPLLGGRTYRVEQNSKARGETEGKILRGRICLSFGNRIWVDQFVEDSKNQPIKSLRTDFFKRLKIAESNLNHMKLLYNMCKDNGYSCQEYEDLNIRALDPEFEKWFYQLGDEKLQWAHIELSNSSNPVVNTLLVSYVMDVDEIVCNQEKFIPELDSLNTELHKEIILYQGKTKENSSYLRRKYYKCGLAVAVKESLTSDPTDTKWVRGLIFKIDENEEDTIYHVLYIDSGNHCKVKISEIAPIPKKYVSTLPAQAIALQLCHVKPKSEDGTWCEDSLNYIYDHLIPGGFCGVVDVVALSKEKSSSDLWPIPTSYISMIFPEDSNDEVGHDLVKLNFAVFVDGAESKVESVKAGILKALNQIVDAQLRSTDKGDNDEDSTPNYGQLTDDEDDDDDRFDVYVGEDNRFHELINGTFPSTSTNSSPCPSSNDSTVATSRSISIQPVVLTPFQEKYPQLKYPEVQWQDYNEQVILRVILPDVVTYEITVGDDKKTLTFITLDPPNYGFQIELFKKVEMPVQVEPLGQFYKIVLTKRLRSLPWDKLTNSKFKWIKVNADTLSAPEEVDEDNPRLPSIISCKTGNVRQKKRYVNYEDNEENDDDEEDDFETDSNIEQLID